MPALEEKDRIVDLDMEAIEIDEQNTQKDNRRTASVIRDLIDGLQEQITDLRGYVEGKDGRGKKRNARMHNFTSLEFLQHVYNNSKLEMDDRITAAKAAIPFEYSKKPAEVKVNFGIEGIFADVIREIGMSDIQGIEPTTIDGECEEVDEE